MTHLDETIAVKVLPADGGAPTGKLADVELLFTAGTLEGLKLLRFTTWEGRGGKSPSVSLPSRQYMFNGERRHFTPLRPTGNTQTQDTLRDTVVAMFADTAPGDQGG